jgi:hypothetical protein
MVSEIDASVPRSPMAYTADMRANFQAAKDEIEELQALLGAGGTDIDFLPLTGGSLSGPLILPLGTATTPALEFGSDQTGFYVQGDRIILRVTGSIAMLWDRDGPLFIKPLDASGNRISNVAPATAGTDAMNRDAGDLRYAPISLADEVAALSNRIASLERQLNAALLDRTHGEVARGMRTELLTP